MPADPTLDVQKIASPTRRDGRAPLAGQEVACRPIGFFLTEAERQGHSAVLLCEGIPFSREHLTDGRSRIDWTSFRRLLANLGSVCSEDEMVGTGRALCRSALSQPLRLVALALSCEEAYRWTTDPQAGVLRQYVTCLDTDLRKVDARRIEIRTSMVPGYEPSPELFLLLQGALAGIPRLLGLREATVELQRSEDTARYVVDLPSERGILRRLRRWVALPKAVRSGARELKETNARLFATSGELDVEAMGRASAEAALRRSESCFYKVFHAGPTGMVISTLEGRFIDVNDSFARGAGLTREGLIGRHVSEFSLWRDPGQRTRFIEGLSDGKSVRGVEAEYIDGKGRVRNALISAEPLTLDGMPCAIWQIMDVTKQKRAESENRRLQKRVLRAQKLESLGVLAGGIAHDFNNLLLGIQGNAELALEEIEPAPDNAREHLRAVLGSSHRAVHLTRELLAYAGKAKRDMSAVDLGKTMQETESLVRSGQSDNKDFDCRVDDGNPVWVEADRAQIQQVMMHLITNAAEAYGEAPGTVQVRVGATEVDSEWLADSLHDRDVSAGAYACLEVRDNGCGMDRNMLERIFDPFFTTKFVGRGLGLAATLGIVRSHGGALKVRSTPGRGSVFQVLLPLSREEPARQEQPADRDASVSCGPILVVDDETTVRDVVRSMLERGGFRTLSADGGAEAIRLLREHRDNVAAVVLDLTMPDMSGEDTFLEMRRIREDLPVVCCSGYGDEAGLQWTEGKARVDFVAKPFSGRTICESLRRLL